MPSPAPLGPAILDNYMKSQAAQQAIPDFFRQTNPTYSANYGTSRPQTAPTQPTGSVGPGTPTAPSEPLGGSPSPLGPLSPQAQSTLISGLLGQAGHPQTWVDQQRLGSGKIDPLEFIRQLLQETPLGVQRGQLAPQLQAPVQAAQQSAPSPLLAQIANLLTLVGRNSGRAK